MNLPITSLVPNPGNPRTISEQKLEQLKKSIQEFPEMLALRPIVVDEHYTILGGNMRYKALESLGHTHVEVYVAYDLTDEQKREFIIKDNSGFGEWDYTELAAKWQDLPLNEWGIQLPDEWTKEAPAAEEGDFESAPPVQTISVLGDLYELNNHRVLCGDSTDSQAVERLMNGNNADIAFTSPPYNAGKTPTEVKMGKESKYANDEDNKSDTEYLALLTDFTNTTLLFAHYSFVNIQSIAGNKTALIDFLYNMKDLYADTIIWNKQNAQPAMAENVLNSQYEYIHVFSHKANRAIGVKKFRGTLTNVLDIQKQNNNQVKEHNATFPLDFAKHFVENFSEQSVLDSFLGSGTTLIVSQQLGRTCYGMELDPKYIDVIVKRYIKYMSDNNRPFVIKRNGQELSKQELDKFSI